MKKPKKSMIILFSILAVIGIAVGGCSMHQYQKKQEMIAIGSKKVDEVIDAQSLEDSAHLQYGSF